MFFLTASKTGKSVGYIMFRGFKIRKENNPDYDSDEEETFGSPPDPELIEVPYGEEEIIIYQIEIESIRGDPVKEHVLYCSVGEKLELFLPLQNPTNEALLFQAKLEGDGVTGDKARG